MNIFKKSDIETRTQTTKSKKLLELNKYQKMHQLLEVQVGGFLSDYADGRINKLTEDFTNDKYRNFGTLLGNQQNFANVRGYKYSNETFLKFCSTFHSVLDGLHISIRNNNLMLEQRNHLTSALQSLSTPNNMKEYFEQHFASDERWYSFEELLSSISVLNTLIFKDEYAIYIERHGMPENYNFDSERLSIILLELYQN
tara:strand:- start:1397 stop:1993 length:597 start_codon:yes stop_codon:yes gene_type:complete